MQDFVLHDSLLRGKSALDHITLGLTEVGVLSLVRLFPIEFEPLFVHCDDVLTASSVLDLLRFPKTMKENEMATAAWLRQFIQSCDIDGMIVIIINKFN